MSAETKFIVSLFHTPSEAAKRIFYLVMRAGFVRTAPDYRIARARYPGHDLLFCVRGSGFIRVAGKQYVVPTDSLAWIDGNLSHAHWPHQESPWELFWIRLDGRQLGDICKILSVRETPVFPVGERRALIRIFRNVFHLMRGHSLAREASLHAEIASLIALLFQTRYGESSSGTTSELLLAPELHKVVTHMSLYYHRPWRIEELARMAGMSVPHFFRCFRKATGSTPIDWLRRERISQAKRRLIESPDSIREISEQVGYTDQFYFSRDFKRLTGFPPSVFRRQEQTEKQRL